MVRPVLEILQDDWRPLTLATVTNISPHAPLDSLDAVPTHAITMGVASIMSARRVLLLAFAEHKAAIVQRAAEGKVSGEVAASYLQEHKNSCVRGV